MRTDPTGYLERHGLPRTARELGCIVFKMEADGFTADRVRCIRCGACSTVAPETFSLRDGTVHVLRQPATPRERELAQAALLICPSHAIGVTRERA